MVCSDKQKKYKTANHILKNKIQEEEEEGMNYITETTNKLVQLRFTKQKLIKLSTNRMMFFFPKLIK